MSIVGFLETKSGRFTRAAAGAVLIVLGLALGGWWTVLAVLGAVAFAAGVFNFCLLRPLFRESLRGQRS